jgi:uncharacterized membrane protein YczE
VPSDRLPERLLRCIVGLTCFGLGISALIAADLGLSPWDVLHQGIGERVGLDIGSVIILVGLVLVVLNFSVLSIRPGLGTMLNAVQIGLVVDLVADHLPRSDAVPLRLTYVAGGILVLAVGSGLYIGAGLGAGPRDGLMLGLHQRGLSLRLGRTVIEATALVIGLLLGGSVGVGTVAFVVGIGPAVHHFIPRLTMPERSTGAIRSVHG